MTRLAHDHIHNTDADSSVISVFQASVTLTNAQIKALPTTPVEVVAAPGPGQAIQFINGFHRLHLVTDYTNVHVSANLVLKNSGNTMSHSNPFRVGDTLYLDYGAPIDLHGTFTPKTVFDTLVFEQGAWVAFENEGLDIAASNVPNGDFTGGSSSNELSISVVYALVDV